MSSAVSYPHISMDERGVVRLGRTRYKVLHLAAEHFHYGWSAEELLRQHTDLRPQEVYSALTYFYDHFEAIAAEMKAFNERGESLLDSQTLSREQLIQRNNKPKE